jgi:serine/threonine protein kinase/tetratricopeptide (TPR) repeat protein
MDSQRWQRLKLILAEALEQESPAARTALVGRSCGSDADLLREVESLLAEAEPLLREAPDEFEECANNFSAAVTREDTSEIGKRIGAYIIIREIGQGGMGTVYLGARADGYFEKQVAIKLLKRGVANEEVLRRFRSEREVLARLDHPNIARLIDAGTTDDGLPYFVMEYIDGIPITRFVDEKHEALAERLNLFLKISAGVEAAHRNSVIHRDLKPSNILVNREGEPKLLDFGIAKVVGNNTNPLELTTLGRERLTPVSASPEQAKGEPVTISSDIYGLGVILYEMLTGVRPHRFLTSDPSREELVEVVCKQLPTLPSLVVKNREKQRQLRGDLDAILIRALQKEPALRYPSVAEFAEDIRRHLTGKPVRAREYEAAYRIKTRLLHNRNVQVSVGAAIIALLFAAAFVFSSRVRSGLKQLGLQRSAASSGWNDAQSPSEKSIAVLPFDIFNNDTENAYFADGVQEAIITDLANVAALKVISRGSVAPYRGKAKNERELGRTLGVSYVVEGSVQKAGDRVRVNAQLIDARTLTEVWAQQYDRKLDDLFTVESDLAQAIVSQLRGKLSPDEKAAIENRPTKDMLAYDLYLRARESFFQDNCPNAVRLLEQAIARDPQFALAYCSLAEVQLYMYRFNKDTTPGRLDHANEAAETALRLAPKLPQSHLAKAQYYYYGLHDYERTQRELAAAPSPSADNAKFVDLAALTERRLGRWRDAIRDGEKAVELDPQNPFITNELVESYTSVRRFTEAERLADKGIKAMVTQNGYLWGLKSQALLGMGRIKEASAVLENSPRDMTHLYRSVLVAMFARDFARAFQLLENATPVEKESDTVPFFDGIVARAQHNAARARSSFQLAHDRMVMKLREHPDDAELISNLSVADAGLGFKEKALREARRAIELCPLSRDAVDAPSYQTMLALVYAWTGERDAALTQLEKIVRLPRGPDYGELRFDPWWDEIRNDPRFDILLSQAALPPVYE